MTSSNLLKYSFTKGCCQCYKYTKKSMFGTNKKTLISILAFILTIGSVIGLFAMFLSPNKNISFLGSLISSILVIFITYFQVLVYIRNSDRYKGKIYTDIISMIMIFLLVLTTSILKIFSTFSTNKNVIMTSGWINFVLLLFIFLTLIVFTLLNIYGFCTSKYQKKSR